MASGVCVRAGGTEQASATDAALGKAIRGHGGTVVSGGRVYLFAGEDLDALAGSVH